MPKVVVTGGGGFLGRALSLRLRNHGYQVVSIARGDYPELRKHGITTLRADLAQSFSSQIASQLSNCDAIFHIAAKTDMWGRRKDFIASNVTSTENLLKFAEQNGIRNFIFTSSPSVIARDTDLLGVDESLAYPKGYRAYYPETKAQAEKLVLSANGRQGVSTVSLRPHLIWGPGDTGIAPFVLKKGAIGKLTQIGSGENVVDFTYIDDCVDAHILALEKLNSNPKIGGEAFFISSGEPVKLWGWVNKVLALNGLKPVSKKISFAKAFKIARALETVCSLIPGQPEPPFTSFIVSQMATSHYFDINKARKLLGYNPKISVDVRLEQTFGRMHPDPASLSSH